MINSSQVHQIKVLLSVLGAGLIAGILIASWMLYNYNPEGSYLVKNVLLDPEKAYSLRFVEPGPKAKSEGKYIFDGMNFSWFDDSTKQVRTLPVAKDQYARLYQRLEDDVSIVEPGSHILDLFNQPHPAVLELQVRSVSGDSSKGIGSVFSRVEFVNGGDNYRIQLRQSAPGTGWIYFHHPKIYQEVLDLLNPKMATHD